MATLVPFPDRMKAKAAKSSGKNMPVWNEKHLRAATDAAGVALWSWNVDTDRITLDDRAFDLWGIAPGSTVPFQESSAQIHEAEADL